MLVNYIDVVCIADCKAYDIHKGHEFGATGLHFTESIQDTGYYNYVIPVENRKNFELEYVHTALLDANEFNKYFKVKGAEHE